MASPRLSDAQVKAFYEDGIVLLKGVFNRQETSEMRAAFDRLHAKAQKIRETQTFEGSYFVLTPRPSDVVVQRVVWCGASENALLRYGADPRLTQPAAQILGSSELQQLINQAHFKLPGDGVSFAFHQDIQHRDKAPGDWEDKNGKGSYVQTLTCVDAMTAENGPLLWVPGSCRSGRTMARSYTYDQGMNSEQDSYLNQSRPLLGDEGDVLLLNPYTLHGSLANESHSARRIFINGYAYPGSNHRVYPGEGSGRLLKV